MTNKNYTGFFKRFCAQLIGWAILSFPGYFVLLKGSESSTIPQAVYFLMLALIVAWFSGLVLVYIDSIFFTYWFGGSIGKLLWGIRVTNLTENKLSFKRILFRQTIGYLFSWNLFGLGYWSVLKDPEKLAWHDKAAGSRVVTKEKSFWIVGLVATVLLVAIALGTLVQVVTNVMKGPLPQQTSTLITTFEKDQQQKYAPKPTDSPLNSQSQSSVQNPNKYYPEDFVSDAFYAKYQTILPFISKQQYTEARDKAVALNTNAKTKYELATSYYLIGLSDIYLKNFLEAKMMLQKAVAAYPNYSRGYALLSRAELQLLEYPQAIKDAEHSLSLTPNDAFSHFALGIALYGNGQSVQGIAEVKKAVALDPTNPDYTQTLINFGVPVPTTPLSPSLSPFPSISTAPYIK